MTFDVLRSGLRWTFWVLTYLFVALAGALVFLVHVPVAGPVRWAMYAVVLWAIAEDLRQKIHPAPQSLHR